MFVLPVESDQFAVVEIKVVRRDFFRHLICAIHFASPDPLVVERTTLGILHAAKLPVLQLRPFDALIVDECISTVLALHVCLVALGGVRTSLIVDLLSESFEHFQRENAHSDVFDQVCHHDVIAHYAFLPVAVGRAFPSVVLQLDPLSLHVARVASELVQHNRVRNSILGSLW